jgi:hypothetical protein
MIREHSQLSVDKKVILGLPLMSRIFTNLCATRNAAIMH